MFFRRTIIIIAGLVITNHLHAQKPVSEANALRVDSMMNVLCKDQFIPFRHYSKPKIKADQAIIKSAFFEAPSYDEKFYLDCVEQIPKKIRREVSETNNGLMNAVQILLKGNYLVATVQCAFIDSVLVSKYIEFHIGALGHCGSAIAMDFDLLKTAFISELDMPIKVSELHIEIDSVYVDNIKNMAPKRWDYAFSLPDGKDEAWIEQIYLGQYRSGYYTSYFTGEAPKDFSRLAKEGRDDILKRLLFSPSYMVSLNAMEALVYRSIKNKISLTPAEMERIIFIRRQNVSFLKGLSDDNYVMTRNYAELHIDDDDIVNKYDFSIRHL